ncbi:hypothetical protein L1987_88379 [Smallanthus sonchifolius]|nr:hypothetical protein L1987_88379 [Smallanthus sonchifolius]
MLLLCYQSHFVHSVLFWEGIDGRNRKTSSVLTCSELPGNGLLSAKLSSIIRVGYPNRPPTLIPDIVILDPGLDRLIVASDVAFDGDLSAAGRAKANHSEGVLLPFPSVGPEGRIRICLSAVRMQVCPVVQPGRSVDSFDRSHEESMFKEVNMSAGVYSSHIDCRDIVRGITIELKSRPKRSNGTVHRQVNLL